jgi:hypothetical protein
LEFVVVAGTRLSRGSAMFVLDDFGEVLTYKTV